MFACFTPVLLGMIQAFPTVIPQLRDKFGSTTPLLCVGVYLFVASPALGAGGNHLMSGIIAGLPVPITGIRPVLDNPALPFSEIMSAFRSLGDVSFLLHIFVLPLYLMVFLALPGV